MSAAFGADPLAEIVPWNPDAPATVQAAAAGVDAIVYLVGENYWRFELRPRLMKQTLDGAIAVGVKRMRKAQEDLRRRDDAASNHRGDRASDRTSVAHARIS